MSDDSTRAGRATSYDVARLAGVSQSAVSRCFRDGASVSPDKRARVEAAAERLGYAPNKIARSLITRRSHIIGLLVTERTARGYPDLLLEMDRAIQRSGNRMLLFTITDDAALAAALADILAYSLDGVIAGITVPLAFLEACARRRIPVVLYNRESPHAWACSVGCADNAAWAGLAAHLVEAGCRRVVFLGGPAGSSVAQDRLRGMQRAAEGLEIIAIRHADFTYAGGHREAPALLQLRPDAIVCANDAMALGVLDGCRAAPGIAISGYDNVPESAWPPYSLTTLAPPVAGLTKAAVAMLGAGDGGFVPGERRLLRATLMVRGSTAMGGLVGGGVVGAAGFEPTTLSPPD